MKKKENGPTNEIYTDTFDYGDGLERVKLGEIEESG